MRHIFEALWNGWRVIVQVKSRPIASIRRA